jgi:hypothetical protein
MTALNNALANGPANGFVYPEQRPLQTMKFWPDLQKLSVDGDEILAAAILDGGTIFWCARPCRHHHIIAAKWRTDEKGFSQEYVHGFLTKNGRFLDRAEAHQMWFFCPGELTTEQLW